MNNQTGILDEVASHTRFLEFNLNTDSDPGAALDLVASGLADEQILVGLGQPLLERLGTSLPGLQAFPEFEGSIGIPATQAALWVAIRGEDRGVISNRSRSAEAHLHRLFSRVSLVDGFKFDSGRDLTGYEDGTENPTGDDAVDAAIVNGIGEGLDGGSFVAVQQWLHDFGAFDALSGEAQDEAIGRHRESNEEFEAPDSAHVKRTAQEDFEPEAFILRRSLPWSDSLGSGLMFVAFGHSFYAFDVQMRKMLGIFDGVEDGLFQFSRPISGAYYWCPPVLEAGKLDVSAIGG